MKIPTLRRTSLTLLFSLMTMWLPTAPVHAALVGTEQVAATGDVAHNRDRVRGFLQRDDVRNMLTQQGVDANVALTRVDSMTDSEVQTVADRLDQLPAGGSSVLGIIFTVFIILLITDILGLTKVFPFTRPVR
jgi:hypothetical protein